MLVQHVDEVARAIGAGHLAVAEHVAGRQELLLEQLHAVARVSLARVVAIGEVEQVNVPLFLGIV